MTKKLAVFPYHPDIEILLKRKNQFLNYELCGLLSYIDDAVLLKRINAILGVSGDQDSILENSDTLLILGNYRMYKSKKYEDVISAAIKKGKEILVSTEALNDFCLQKFKGFYKTLALEPDVDRETEDKISFLKSKKYDFDTPVLAVLGQGRNSGKFDCQLTVKRVLENEGYQVACINTNSLGALFGCYTMPEFIYNNGYTFEEKVIKFNNYLYALSKNIAPDIFLIGVPEGIASFYQGEYNHFTEYATIMANAVSVDIGIFCLYFMETLSLDGIQRTNDLCIKKYNIPIGGVSLSNTIFAYNAGRNRLDYFFLDQDYIEKYGPDVVTFPFPVIDTINEESAAQAVGKITGYLQSNVDII